MAKQDKNIPSQKKVTPSKHIAQQGNKSKIEITDSPITNKAQPAPSSKKLTNKKDKAVQIKTLKSKITKENPIKNSKNVTAPDEGKKSPKEKVIRDSFTMPRKDYEKISALKQNLFTMGISAKKNEVLRAGLYALEALTDKGLKEIISKVEHIKAGRPK